MGVPSFFRWLVRKYPEIVSDAANSEKNKNPKSDGSDLEFDHLYLDMNGIIHPCFHPDDTTTNLNPPTTFEEVFQNIYEYIDKLFDIVRPRKLLFLAIDGVAPRAKMNQQRARRFKSAKENENFEEVEKKFRKEFEMCGKEVLPREKTELDDSNIITPGTEFMHLLSKKLQRYIKLKMNDDPHWKTIKVILSDANVPGEGEHKVMSFIRAQRCSEGYDPNIRHCLYGLDADLIMLALATHEVHFAILRECLPTSGSYHLEATTGSEKLNRCEEHNTPAKNMRFQFLKVWLLREYLDIDMCISDPPENVKVDLERAIDDFIFICFFAGNDFLPHMPTLEIHEGAIDLLIHVYKNEFKNFGGYLVDVQRIEDKKNGYFKLKRVEKFILSVGEYEEKIFKKRTEISESKRRKILREQSNDVEDEDHISVSLNLSSGFVSADHVVHSDKDSVVAYTSSNSDEKGSCTDNSELLKNTKELRQKVKDYIRSQSDAFKNGGFTDKVKLASTGFKDRYYSQKFSAKSSEEIVQTRKELVQKYTEGLLWVLKYYFSGVPSWNWFYPYHYGPFASDLKGLSQVKVQFQKGLPLKPYDQLLAVLPPQSAHALPGAYQKLMVDMDSGIADFYPTNFQTDADGKRFMWQAVCKLPFIAEDRLLKETRKVEKDLKEHEKVRIAETTDRLFVGASSSFGEQISEVYKSHYYSSQNDAMKINSELSDGLHGIMCFCEGNEEEVPSVLCLLYKLPEQCNYKHHLLEGVTIPEKTIAQANIVENQLWHESTGYNTHRAPVKQCKEPNVIHARGGWGRGRGNFENSTISTRKSTAPDMGQRNGSCAWRPCAQTSASSLNSSLEEQQCALPASDHDPNIWRSAGRGSLLRESFASKLKSGGPMVKEPDVIHRDAGVGWSRGRGRGRIDDSRHTASESYPQPPGNNFSSSTYATSASRLDLSLKKQCNLSEESSARSWRNSAATSTSSSAGSWRNGAALFSTSSAGPRDENNTSFTSAAWRGQQSNGRGGPYVHKTTRNTRRNSYQ